MARIFETKKKILFREGDPAQIMYFGNLFSFAHDAFEEFIVAAGYAWEDWFRKGDVIIPIRHTEGDFLAPFRPGHTYDVHVTVSQIRETSFEMKYVFGKEGKTHGVIKMVHSVIESKTMQKTPLPSLMRERLTPYLEKEI